MGSVGIVSMRRDVHKPEARTNEGREGVKTPKKSPNVMRNLTHNFASLNIASPSRRRIFNDSINIESFTTGPSPTISAQLDALKTKGQTLKGKTVPFNAIKHFSQPTGNFITTYVAAVIDKNRAILMVPGKGGNAEVTIRMTKDTSVGNVSKSIDCSTLYLTQEMRVYGVVPTKEVDAKYPTWSAARWIATKIMPHGPVPTTIKTIGFSYRGHRGDLFPLISDETPRGFLVNQALIQKTDKDAKQTPAIGTMFMVQSYHLRKRTRVNKMSDTEFYFSNPEAKPGIYEKDVFVSDIVALNKIVKAKKSEMEMCRTKCHSKFQATKEDYEFFIGRASASMAAFESYVRKIDDDRYVFSISSKMTLNNSGTFTTNFSFHCPQYDEKVSNVWAKGAKTMAVFRGTTKYKTSVEITSFARRDNRGFATVEFPKNATEFLISWNKVAWKTHEKVTYGPAGGPDDQAYQSIRALFRENFLGKKLFMQYVGALKPTKSTQELTEKQKRMGEIELDEFQSRAMETILYSDGISLTQAPPGSGKTALIAAVTRELIESGEAETVIITGTTNIAVDNALSTLVSIAGEMDDFRQIRIASINAMSYSVDIEKKWTQQEKAMNFEEYIPLDGDRKVLQRLRTYALSDRRTAKETAESAKIVVNRYINVKESEKTLEESFTERFGPNVIATTTSLLLRNSEKIPFQKATHILIDESSQLVPTELLAILSAYPNLKKVAIIGDEYQLAPYSDLPEESDAIKCFGTADLIRLNKEYGEAATKLKRIYRSHPQMTKNLINAFYPYELEAGATLENRNMAKQLNLPTCSDGTPVRAYHVDGIEVKGANQEEADAICQFIQQLMCKGVKTKDILVLTFHCNQRCLLSTILPTGIRVKTIDSAQGQQSPITIVATTKTSKAAKDESVLRAMQFVANSHRGTVALSRGLQATYIFGNLPQLEVTKFWKPVIRSIRALNGTSNEPPIETPIEKPQQHREENPEETLSPIPRKQKRNHRKEKVRRMQIDICSPLKVQPNTNKNRPPPQQKNQTLTESAPSSGKAKKPAKANQKKKSAKEKSGDVDQNDQVKEGKQQKKNSRPKSEKRQKSSTQSGTETLNSNGPNSKPIPVGGKSKSARKTTAAAAKTNKK